jgi:hypothetical protein
MGKLKTRDETQEERAAPEKKAGPPEYVLKLPGHQVDGKTGVDLPSSARVEILAADKQVELPKWDPEKDHVELDMKGGIVKLSLQGSDTRESRAHDQRQNLIKAKLIEDGFEDQTLITHPIEPPETPKPPVVIKAAVIEHGESTWGFDLEFNGAKYPVKFVKGQARLEFENGLATAQEVIRNPEHALAVKARKRLKINMPIPDQWIENKVQITAHDVIAALERLGYKVVIESETSA